MIGRCAGLALCALSLAACDNLLGLHEINPDGEVVALSFAPVSKTLPSQPLGLLTVTALDIRNHPVPGFTGEVTLTFGNNPSGAALLGTIGATAVEGVARFDLVGIDKPGVGYTLVASTPGLPAATSEPIDIVAPAFTPIATGIPGGLVTSVAVSPAPAGGTASLFAGAGDGVYKSVDGGATWRLANFGADVAARLAADPSRPGVVYLGRTTGSVPYFLKKTVDGGANWHELALNNRDLASSYVYHYTIDPKNPSVIYAASSKLRRSGDGGATWTDLALQAGCLQVAVDPMVADTLYCRAYASQNGQPIGIQKSSNGGASWGPANTGLQSMQVENIVATPGAVFAVNEGTLYRSTDGAASWTSLTPMYPSAIAYAPSMPQRVYLALGGSVLVSNDGGATFGTPVNAQDYLYNLTVDPTNPDLVYGAGNTLGVLVSTNAGATWSASSNGIDVHQASSVAVIPGAPGTLLATIRNAVIRSTNGGASWTTVVPREATVYVDPAVSTRVYLCGYQYLAVSTNSGATFTPGTATELTTYCQRLLIAGSTLYAVGGGQLLKSTDSGAHWVDTRLGASFYVYDAALADATGTVVVAATTGGVYRSTNAGGTFMQVTPETTYSIIADPKAPANLVVGSNSQSCGLRRSTDSGASFGALFAAGPCVEKLASAGGVLYAASTGALGATLQTSTDGGAQWTPVELAGVPRGLRISWIATSEDSTAVYVATDAGLYRGAK